jgi:hypothetical protein
MKTLSRSIFVLAVLVTLAALVTWQATGGDWYTKFSVVEQVEEKADADDPLAAAGFYDGETVTRTESRDEFRLGLLPTPSGLLDKHIVSVVTLVAPFWVLWGAAAWVGRRRGRAKAAS